MRRVGRALWWLGPWIGLAAFVWRQQGLEARLAAWVEATNQAVSDGIGRLTDVTAQYMAEGEHGRVRDAPD